MRAKEESGREKLKDTERRRERRRGRERRYG